ncbi:MAG TPA: MGMT family protein [Candidatus Nanoarchaeia archaeon]|nr:MGMT family protein [Candidatus Nanoarchaeia archaeon]
MDFCSRVWVACRRIPKGKVSTYREIGKALDSRAYRAIGQALRRNPYAPEVPCHRVVSSDGTIGGFQGCCSGKPIRQKTQLLRQEGVEIKKNRIVNFPQQLFRF